MSVKCWYKAWMSIWIPMFGSGDPIHEKTNPSPSYRREASVFYESNPFDLTISRREIAELISTSPESVSRLIGKFKSQGIIKGTGQTIEIVDVEGLETMCKCKLLDSSKI